MNLTNMELGLIVVEGTILLSLLVLILRGKRSFPSRRGKSSLANSPAELERLDAMLRESKSISLNLSKNLEEKKEITQRLMEGLEEKIKILDRRLNQEEIKPIPKGPQEREIQAKVLEMSKAGSGLADIARSLNLPHGEVQLIFDLQKYAQ
jgi:hypothetical protein